MFKYKLSLSPFVFHPDGKIKTDGKKNQAFFDTVLEKLEDEIRYWFHANGYTNPYNITLTASEGQRRLNKKKRRLEEKQL